MQGHFAKEPSSSFHILKALVWYLAYLDTYSIHAQFSTAASLSRALIFA